MSERQVNNYAALFHQERRIYHLQGVRVPQPNGVPLAPVGYAAVTVIGLYLATRMPVLGPALAVLPFQVRWILLPALVATVIWNVQPDGSGVTSWLRALVCSRARRLTRALRPRPTVAGVRRTHVPDQVIAAHPDRLGPATRGVVVNRGERRLVLQLPVAVELRRRRGGSAPLAVHAADDPTKGRSAIPLRPGERLQLVGDER